MGHIRRARHQRGAVNDSPRTRRAEGGPTSSLYSTNAPQFSDAQPLMLKMNYLSPVKKLASPLRRAKILFVDPATDSAEVERCDNVYDALIKTKK